MNVPRKVLLPVFQLTELTNKSDPRAIERSIKINEGTQPFTYHHRVVLDEYSGQLAEYNLFPVVLEPSGAPWALGSLFVLSEIENGASRKMKTYDCLAGDIGAFREWLNKHDRPDDLLGEFPSSRLDRVTYRYHRHVQRLVKTGELAGRTGNRMMGRVVRFYKWLASNRYVAPKFPAWEDRRFQIPIKTADGRAILKKIATTDLTIRVAKSEDPLSPTIKDGGELRPLPLHEQNWLIEAMHASGNTECYLLHLFMLATGARVQTAATLQVRHFAKYNPGYGRSIVSDEEVFRLSAGPGTAIDTKGDTLGVLHVPRSLFELLHVYATSKRAIERRSRFIRKHGEHADQYLFLTQQGNPYYQTQTESICFDVSLDRRHEKVGQTIRTFVREWVIPYIQKRYDEKFHYRLHDLRATFGMNVTEHLLTQVQTGKISLLRARTIVKELMWHRQLSTTDQYLNYRNRLETVLQAVNDYGKQMQEWIAQARDKTEGQQ